MLSLLQLIIVFFSLCFNAAALDTELIPSKEELLRLKVEDIVLGSPDAQNIIIEYSSLACPHCADYYIKDFPQIKRELINPGKVKYVYRDFPTTRSALYATGLARCITKKDEKIQPEEFFRLLQLLFQSQASWAFSNNYQEQLIKLLNLGGFSQEKIKFCSQVNDEHNKEIVSQAFLAIKALDIVGSPAIFVNGKMLSNHDFLKIREQLK
jgi:protein-disulfide isomerase